MSSPIKRKQRRTAKDIEVIRRGIEILLAEDSPMTCRQIFYRLVSEGFVDKTENEYKCTVIRLLGEMRRDRRTPYRAISDNTRWMRKPDTYDCVEDMLRESAKVYRRALWNDQNVYVEVWLEKEALAGVTVEVTREYDVPLMVTRGFSVSDIPIRIGL